jgi:hypothetical protein
MTYREEIIRVLEQQREARRWTDEGVADALIAALHLDSHGVVPQSAPVSVHVGSVPVFPPTEVEPPHAEPVLPPV